MLYLTQYFKEPQNGCMYQKIGKKNERGQDLYQQVTVLKSSSGFEKVFGSVGTLADLNKERVRKPKEVVEKEKH